MGSSILTTLLTTSNNRLSSQSFRRSEHVALGHPKPTWAQLWEVSTAAEGRERSQLCWLWAMTSTPGRSALAALQYVTDEFICAMVKLQRINGYGHSTFMRIQHNGHITYIICIYIYVYTRVYTRIIDRGIPQIFVWNSTFHHGTYIHPCMHCIALQYITYITYIYPMMNNTSVNF